MRDFKKLVVWQKATANLVKIHLFARKLPREEKYELGSQLRRAAFSIPANISEGSSKSTNPHYKQFLETALGSSFETETALIVLQELYPTFTSEIEQYSSTNIE